MKHYAQILRDLREDNDETQKDIADLLGINQRVYSRYETGKNLMPITYLKPLCEHFNVSADYVLGIRVKKSK
jgi:transcriptional regulator with XRE-family HTH domain